MRKINKHIIHCSDSGANTTVEDIYKWHVEENGWQAIGYHYIIYPDGSIHKGRDINIMGAHCKGNNRDSVGTCLIGRDKFTTQQLTSLQYLHNFLKMLYNDSMKLHGHRDFSSKTCPNFDVHQFIKE